VKTTHRPASTKFFKLASVAVCYCLILATATPVGTTQGSASAQPMSGLPSAHQTAFVALPTKFFGALMALWQGGGPPSVPGTGLPDLDAARQIPFALPVAPAAIVSTQACNDCTPCPTCGPGGANHAPVVSAGGPYYGTVGTPVVVSGLGSFDLDAGDSISVYTWNFGDGSAPVQGAMPEHTYSTVGTRTISLTVADRHNATTTTTTTVSIAQAPPSVPPSGTTQGNAAQFIAQSAPSTMTAGQSYPVSVTMRNTGTTTWSAAQLYRLGSQSPQDNGVWGRARVYLPTTVAPGADVTFNFTVVGPYSGLQQPPPAHGAGWCAMVWRLHDQSNHYHIEQL
jgi:hypothetical protein